MILITSMGGCGSTSNLFWFKSRITCNCPINSEGLSRVGPGANSNGLKHRIEPPNVDDKYLKPENNFNRTDLNYGDVSKALFVYDSPLNIVPSLFNRKIASGHAMAITGKRPNHANSLDKFVEEKTDSFSLEVQYDNWTDANVKRPYPRMLVNFSHWWDHLSEILDFLEIADQIEKFPKKRNRNTSFENLSNDQQIKLHDMYQSLINKIENSDTIRII
jgi:hypothetical protein